MLNEERIILMTRMASFEEHEGKKNMSIGSYFRSDFIGLQIIKAIIYATLAFFIVLAVYIFYDFEVFMTDIYHMDLFAFAKQVLVYYIVSVSIYGLITYLLYTVRYAKAKKQLKVYYGNLKRLSNLYDKEGKRQV